MKKNVIISLAALVLALALAACGSSPETSAPGQVGLDAAKTTALGDAQQTASAVTFTTAQLDERNGLSYYDLRFNDGATSYRYAVDATTGVIIESSSEAMQTGTAQAGASLTEAEAREIALQHAGLAESDLLYERMELDMENGVLVYDVEFYAGTTEYDYEIDAATGEIRSYDHDIEGYTPPAATSGQEIGVAAAREIALQHAGVSEADAVYLQVKPDMENGVMVYDVEFYAGATEYDYEISAATGDILSYDYDIEGYTPAGSTSGQASQSGGQTGSGAVTEAEARAIALQHAGVSESDTVYLQVKLDYDDGVQVYDVEFYAGSTEYDYEISAATGEILGYDYDAEGYTPSANASGAAKSEEEVRSIALSKVPGATAENIRLQLDRDDGKLLYEGKIVYDGMEYEFEIDAYSGAILEWEAESVYD